tara:strand:+ start:36359 stop:37315 length:957 start_codon:yes stop_codon:yes gene_type:complete
MNLKSFLDKYEILADSQSFVGAYRKGVKKRCKFCGKTEPETTFKMKPHVISELFGKNNVTSNEECDYCNNRFSRYESDLANFISPYNSILGRKTKKKVPIFQSRKSGKNAPTTIRFTEGNPHIFWGKNLSDFTIDEEAGILSVRIQKKKYNPMNIYKMFSKIAISLSPDSELSEMNATIHWILNEDRVALDIPPFVWRNRLFRKYFKTPSAVLHIRKPSKEDSKTYLPKYCLIVYTGNLIFQMFLPLINESIENSDMGKELSLEIYPGFALDYDHRDFESRQKPIKVKFHTKDYLLDNYVPIEEDEMIHFKFDGIESG